MGPKLFSIMLFLLVAVGVQFAEISHSAGPPQQNQGDQADISFRWAFGRLVKKGQDHEFASVNSDTIMKTGDRLKMLVEAKKKCFVYVIHRNAEGKVNLLFPYELKQFDADIQISKRYQVPEGDKLFELDDRVGLETFFLLASAQRLYALERLIQDYQTAEAAKKTGFAEKIISEIRELRSRYGTLKTPAERPVQIVGGVRGTPDAQRAAKSDVASIATEISGKTFYSRTFTIDHQ